MTQAHQPAVSLNRNSPIPLYHQLALSIEAAINTGELAPGDRLENEMAMTARLGLSRPTTRQAIHELVKKGMLVRKRGVGTQVVESRFRRDERLSSLNEDLAKAGRTPSTVLLSYQVGEIEPDVVAAVDGEHLTSGVFTKIRRLRSSDGVPLAILTNYIPEHFSINEVEVIERGLYACLNSLGARIKIAHQRISSRLLTVEEAGLLDEPTPAACLAVERLTYDDVGQLVEIGRHIYPASRYSIHTTLEI